MPPRADFYFRKSQKWQQELTQLRAMVLGCGLVEELKWGVPCYSFQNSNVLLLHEFKEYCALLFVKGALLHDSDGILIQQTEHTQAARQIRFTSVAEIVAQEARLKAYVYEAIEVERLGLKVGFKKVTEYPIPEEFQTRLNESPDLQTAFAALTPGRQRAYLIYFADAKQARTREARIEKCRPQILAGKGLHDDYVRK